jgi:hypothetical protein
MDTVIETATKFGSMIIEQRHLVAYYIGIFFVIVSHLFMLRMPNMYWHSIFNLLAAMMIAYYFMDKEFGGKTVVVVSPPVVPAPVEPTPEAEATPAV